MAPRFFRLAHRAQNATDRVIQILLLQGFASIDSIVCHIEELVMSIIILRRQDAIRISRGPNFFEL